MLMVHMLIVHIQMVHARTVHTATGRMATWYTETVDTETVDTETVDTETVDTETVDTEMVDAEMVDTEMMDTETVHMKTVHQILWQPSSRCHIVQMEYFAMFQHDRRMRYTASPEMLPRWEYLSHFPTQPAELDRCSQEQQTDLAVPLAGNLHADDI